MLEQILDPVPERRGRRRTAGTRALEGEIDGPIAETPKIDITAIIGDRRADMGFDQFLDRCDGLGIVAREELLAGLLPRRHRIRR